MCTTRTVGQLAADRQTDKLPPCKNILISTLNLTYKNKNNSNNNKKNKTTKINLFFFFFLNLLLEKMKVPQKSCRAWDVRGVLVKNWGLLCLAATKDK